MSGSHKILAALNKDIGTLLKPLPQIHFGSWLVHVYLTINLLFLASVVHELKLYHIYSDGFWSMMPFWDSTTFRLTSMSEEKVAR